MSLITCCPVCGTMFKVVADQLKISEGWVRCGHCANVFDATAHMTQADLPPATGEPQPELESAQDPWAEPRRLPKLAPEAPSGRDFDASFEARFESELRAEGARAGEALTAPASLELTDALTAPASLDLAEAPTAPAWLDRLEARRESARSEAPPSQGLGDDLPVFDHSQLEVARAEADQAEAELHGVSFLRNARRRAFWKRPSVRILLFLLALSLAAALTVQLAVHERDRLAAAEPALKPWLQELCVAFRCTVGPPRQIEAIAIDSSSFNKLRSDTYRLSFTLKNGATIPVATPSMELTLTDTQDQPVIRRVLTPGEMGAAAAVLAPGGEWSGGVTLALSGNGNSGRIAGYRLLAFYP
jgi:predicted Zn finger-like uncharacterized protein